MFQQQDYVLLFFSRVFPFLIFFKFFFFGGGGGAQILNLRLSVSQSVSAYIHISAFPGFAGEKFLYCRMQKRRMGSHAFLWWLYRIYSVD